MHISGMISIYKSTLKAKATTQKKGDMSQTQTELQLFEDVVDQGGANPEIENRVSENDDTTTSISKPNGTSRELALQEHHKIIDNWNQLGQDWVAFTRRVQKFKHDKLFRYIADPATGSPFTRFDGWAKSFLGHSASKIFADLKVLRELGGVVSDPKLAQMSKQNAHQLLRRKQQNKVVDAVVVEDAAHLKAAEFAARYPLQGNSEAGKDGNEVCYLGPFQVSEKTAELFSRALDIAKRHCESIGQSGIDDVIAALAQSFISTHDESGVGYLLPETVAAIDPPPSTLM